MSLCPGQLQENLKVRQGEDRDKNSTFVSDISDLIFMISFLLLTLGFFFVLLSLIALGVRLGCLFEVFLVS